MKRLYGKREICVTFAILRHFVGLRASLMNADRCTCPEGSPRLIHHEEDGPVTVVKHHDPCSLSSVRVSGVHLPVAVFEDRVRAAVGEKRPVATEERHRG